MAARIAFGAGSLFLLMLAVLHLLRPDLDPTWRVISEYEIGPLGGLMRLAFFALAIAAATLGFASYSQIRTLGGYLGLVLLGLSAVGMVLAGLFETDPITASAGARTPDGRLHELGAMLDSVPFAAPLISCSMTRGRSAHPTALRLRWVAWVPLIGTVLITHCAWLMLAAAYLLRLPVSPPTSHVAA